VISDYAKGVLTDGVAFEIIKEAREAGALIVVEPKGGDHIRYRGADLLMPSRRELADATGMPTNTEPEVVAAARALIERCGFGAVVVSLGRDQMMLIEPRSSAVFETMAHGESYDSGGTDDTAVAAIAAGLGAGLSRREAVHLASLAAGIVGSKTGTAVASAGELAAALASEAVSEIAEPGLRVEVPAQPRRRGQRKA
jgi:D-beta-D-heptose 7-phosphate kinase / D-beta-D-heptose 1-phosphate adenosyltransferase